MTIILTGQSTLSAPVAKKVKTTPAASQLAGIVLAQEAPGADFVETDNGDWFYQSFRLPNDYPRGTAGNLFIPKLCGLQVCVGVETNWSSTATLDWRIDWWDTPGLPGIDTSVVREGGWVGLCSGTEVGAPYDGDQVWFDINFEPQSIEPIWWRQFRFGVCARPFSENAPRNEIAEISDRPNEILLPTGDTLNIIPTISPAPLMERSRYLFSIDEDQFILDVSSGGEVTYSQQQGITKLWFSTPNPLTAPPNRLVKTPLSQLVKWQIAWDAWLSAIAAQMAAEAGAGTAEVVDPGTEAEEGERIVVETIPTEETRAYEGDGVTSIVGSDNDSVSLRFRILGLAPDSDRDCMGNDFRTVVVKKDPSGIKHSVGDLQNAYWLSAPNPSKFAIENLYFDMRDGSDAVVIDHMLIDTVTPGIYMNVYYSNDPAPGDDNGSWDALLWTPVPKTYLLRRRETFALPAPITAKYIKLEFTHLQPIWYAPGSMQYPAEYRKHPKWVLDYYLAQYDSLRAQDLEHAPSVSLTYDAFDLAYNYYLDDIRQDQPLAPDYVDGSQSESLLTDFLSREQQSALGQVDAGTLAAIKTSFVPFTNHPITQSRFNNILRSYGNSTDLTNYSTESITTASAGGNEVSSLNREALIMEKQFPVTSFYLPCRHIYKVSSSTFEQDRAYFAGIKEVGFSREHYATRFDHDLYIESGGDGVNIESNDFASVDQTWVTSNDS
jgi:hypothetical protein